DEAQSPPALSSHAANKALLAAALTQQEIDSPNVPSDDPPIQLTGGTGNDLLLAQSGSEPPPLPPAEDSERSSSAAGSEAGLTLAALEQLALEHNPAIQEAAAAAQKSVGYRWQVGRYPNPFVGYSGQQLFDAGTDQHLAMIEQDFVTGKKLRLSEQVLDHEVQSQLWEVEAQRYRVLTDIRLRFYEALAAQRRVELADEFHHVTEEGVRVAIKRKEALEGSQPEVLQAEIQLNEIDLLRRRAQIAYEAAWKDLAATAGVPQMSPTPLSGSLDPAEISRDWDATYQSVVGTSPELRAAYARVNRARANLDRQQAQPIPNVGVILQGGYDQGTNSHIVNLQVGVPVPIFNRNRGNIAAAFAEYSQATHDARLSELSLKARRARVAQEFDSAAAGVQRYSEVILLRAQKTLKLSKQAYAVDELNFLRVVIACTQPTRVNEHLLRIKTNQPDRSNVEADSRTGRGRETGQRDTPFATSDCHNRVSQKSANSAGGTGNRLNGNLPIQST
ncbi:MAG: TolC family protein, partial [Planctomycetaceae bacterium]